MPKPGKKAPKKPKVTVLKPVNSVARQELARLRNLQSDFYGATGDDKRLIKWANLVGMGKRTPGSQDWKVKGGRATNDPEALRAGKLVSSELNPQISASKNYEAGLEKLYGQLVGDLGQSRSNINTINDATKKTVAGNYDNLASTIAGEFRKSREASNSELERLGIQMGDASQSADVEARLASLAQSGKQNALASQELSGQGFNQLMALMSSQASGTGANLRAQASQERGQLEASRPNKVYSLWQQYEDQARAEEAEKKQQQFLNRITQSKFGVDSDYKTAQALAALARARKSIRDSNKPVTVRKPRITR